MNYLLDWSSKHKQLQIIMKEELEMLRELLSALYEEEANLLQGFSTSSKGRSSKRSLINKQLKLIQKKRNDLTKLLGSSSPQAVNVHHFNSKTFNELIAKDEECSMETFALRDQIINIMKIIRQYKERIDKLIKYPDTSSYLVAHTLSATRKKNQQIQVLNAEDLSSE
jgi:hypothetical protein